MAGDFAFGRSQSENLKAVVENILSEGNENCLLPGQIEALAAKRTAENGGLLFSLAEIEAFNEIAAECGREPWSLKQFNEVTL